MSGDNSAGLAGRAAKPRCRRIDPADDATRQHVAPVTDARFQAPGRAKPDFLWRTHPPLAKAYLTFTTHEGVNGFAFSPGGAFGFVDDANDNGERDPGETIAFLFAALGRLCEGTVVKLDDVQIDFTPGTAHATAGSVRKDPDTCTNATPGPTARSTPGPSPTPYSVAAPLHPPPSTMLAMLYGAGAVGLLLPVRRRRRRK